MRKLFLILGGVAVAAIAAVTCLAYYLADSKKAEENSKRTQAARAARWAKPDTGSELPDVKYTPEENQPSKTLLDEEKISAL